MSEAQPRRPSSILLLLVAISGFAALTVWILFNIHVFADLEDDLPHGQATRVAVFRILALILGPSLGSLSAMIAWRGFGPVNSRVMAMLRGVIAGAAAGAAGWFLAAILLCIGHSADGQTPLAAMILGIAGAALHVLPGGLSSWIGWWLRSRERPP